MSFVPAPALSAIAFQLSAALENYQSQIDRLSDPWSQRREYDVVSRVFDQIRMLKGALPELSVDMVEVLISHVELMKALWLSGSSRGEQDEPILEDVRSRHREAVARMYAHCLRIFRRD
jgi:hypothetical protein